MAIKTYRERAFRLLNKTFPDEIARGVEQSINTYTVNCMRNMKFVSKKQLHDNYNSIYAKKVRSISFNANHFSTFKESIISNSIEYDTIPYLSHDQMSPQGPHAMMKEKLISKEIKIAENIAKLDAEKKESKGLYTCKRCKSTCTVFQEVQTRSADEPMTIFVTCMNCDNRWKE